LRSVCGGRLSNLGSKSGALTKRTVLDSSRKEGRGRNFFPEVKARTPLMSIL